MCATLFTPIVMRKSCRKNTDPRVDPGPCLPGRSPLVRPKERQRAHPNPHNPRGRRAHRIPPVPGWNPARVSQAEPRSYDRRKDNVLTQTPTTPEDGAHTVSDNPPKTSWARSWLSRLATKTTVVAALTVIAGGITVAPVQAQNPHERGPEPTEESVTAARGHLDTDTERVSSLRASGFGGGTIYYPTDTSEGTYGGVVVAPGYTAGQSSMSWYGHRLASQGFVVFTIDTNTRFDQPNSRG